MKSLLSNEEEFKNVKIDSFSYPSGIFAVNKKNKFIDKILSIGFIQLFSKDCFSISELSNQLSFKIENDFKEYKNLILVGHSMGGIIARKYLLTHSASNVSKLILYASPVQGSAFATFLNYFVKTNKQLMDLKRNSKLLKDLNFEWKNSEETKKLKVINVVTPFDQYISINKLYDYWNPEPDEFYIIKNKLHLSIIFPKNTSDKVYSILKNNIT